MRNIDKIIYHCSDSKPSMDIGVEEIRKWHTDAKNQGGRGWNDIGYHLIVRKDGSIEKGRKIKDQGAHCFGQNKNSIGVCWVGGYGGVDDRTDAQKKALKYLDTALKLSFDATSHGHNEFSNKTCPNFDVKSAYDVFHNIDFTSI